MVISNVVVLLCGGFLGFLYLAERTHLLREAEESRYDAARKLARVCQDSTLSKDEISLVNYIKDLTRSPDVLWAMFIDPRGRIVNHSQLSLKNKILSDPPSLRAAQTEQPYQEIYEPPGGIRVLESVVPVRLRRERMGAARIAFDALKSEARIRDVLGNTLKRFLLVTLASLIIGILAAFHVARALTRPIQALTEGARKIGQGKLDTRIPVTDSDEIGQLSSEFNRMAAQLGELDDLKDQFIAAVSHDLRNPLGSIVVGASSLLSRDVPDDKRETVLHIVLSAARRLTDMVNNILDTAKMKAGRLEYDMKPLRPDRILEEVCTLYEMRAKDLGLTLRRSVEQNPPEVKADEAMIHRVLSNILANAVKFTPEGGEITAGARSAPESQSVEFFVRDTGTGIAQSELPYIFQRFVSVSQIDPSFKKQRGAGLGLSITKKIIEDHGGKIWVESKLGKGTTFRWTLPAMTSKPQPSGRTG